MANAYSILHNYATDLYTPNYQLIGSVLQYKQGKLNANRKNLQTLYNQLSIIDVAKQEDQDYVEGRLNAARDITNKYSALDLSHDSFANDLVGKLSEVIDDNVKNAVIGTRIYRNEQKAWNKLKEDKPELYNDTNRKYAERASDAWLNDGKTGSKYRGGGGVIEYDDYQKRWQESIPEISKALGDNYEYVALENGSGMFVDKVTRRAADRGTLSNIMDSILGEKGRRQQTIDAWGRYDGADAGDIKSEYDSFLNPKIDEADRKIKGLEALVKSSTGQEKEMYQASLDSWKERKISYVNNSFDNLVKKNGEAGVTMAYQTMFAGQVKEPWLDVYSYDEKVVDRKVDDNHVKTLEFQEKIREFNLNYDLKLKELEKKGTKGTKGTKGVEGHVDSEGNPTIIEEDLSLVDLKEGEIDNFANYQKTYYEGVKDLKGVVGNLSMAQLVDVGHQLSGRDFSNSDKITIKVNGKDKEINFLNSDGTENGNRQKLLSYMDKSFNSTPEVRAIREQILKDVESIQNRLVEEISVNPDIASDFAKFNKEIKRVGGTDDNPIYDIVDVKSGNRYVELLKKASSSEGLTEDEQLTLDMYSTIHYIGDPKLDNSISREAYVAFRQEMVDKIGYKAFSKMPQSHKDIRSAGFSSSYDGDKFSNTLSNKAKAGYDKNPSMYKPGAKYFDKILELTNNGITEDFISKLEVKKDESRNGNKLLEAYSDYVTADSEDNKRKAEKALQAVITSIEKTRGFITKTSTNDDAYLSQLGSYDVSTDKNGKSSFTNMINESNKRKSVAYEPSLEGSFFAPEVPQYLVRTEDSSYESLSELIQSKTGDEVKGPISIAVDIDQRGVRTGKGIIYKYTNKDGDIINIKDEGDSDKYLSEYAVAQIGIPFSQLGRTPYDGKFGKHAPKIQLGGSKASQKVEERVSQTLARGGQVLAMNNKDLVTGILEAAGEISPLKKAEVAQDIIDFRGGRYNFTLESDNDDYQYKIKMWRDGKLVNEKAVTNSFSEQELSMFIGNQADFNSGNMGVLYYKHALFNDYLNNKVMKSEIDAELQISKAEVETLLNQHGQ